MKHIFSLLLCTENVSVKWNKKRNSQKYRRKNSTNWRCLAHLKIVYFSVYACRCHFFVHVYNVDVLVCISLLMMTMIMKLNELVSEQPCFLFSTCHPLTLYTSQLKILFLQFFFLFWTIHTKISCTFNIVVSLKKGCKKNPTKEEAEWINKVKKSEDKLTQLDPI